MANNNINVNAIASVLSALLSGNANVTMHNSNNEYKNFYLCRTNNKSEGAHAYKVGKISRYTTKNGEKQTCITVYKKDCDKFDAKDSKDFALVFCDGHAPKSIKVGDDFILKGYESKYLATATDADGNEIKTQKGETVKHWKYFHSRIAVANN